MVTRFVRQFHTTQHAGDLLQTLLLRKEGDGGIRPLIDYSLRHPVVTVAVTGDLRQMRNAKDLMVAGHLFEFPTHDLRRGPPDTAVDFVEEADRP